MGILGNLRVGHRDPRRHSGSAAWRRDRRAAGLEADDAITIGEIFGLGLLFGWLRARTGSTLTTIALHGIADLGTLMLAAVLAG